MEVRTIKKILVISIVLTVSVTACDYYLGNRLPNDGYTADGLRFDKSDLFRVQIANDPFFDSIIFNHKFTYDELIEYGFVDWKGDFNRDERFLKEVVYSRGNPGKIKWDEIYYDYWGFEKVGNFYIKYEVWI